MAEQQKSSTHATHNVSGGTQQPVQPTHVIVDQPIALSNGPKPEPNSNQNTPPEKPLPRFIRPEWVIVYVTILYTFLSWRTLRAIKRQADIMEQQAKDTKASSEEASRHTEELARQAVRQSSITQSQLEITNRAWVGISAAELIGFGPDERVRAILRIKNTGNTFALNARLFQRIVSLYGPLTDFPETQTDEPGITLFPGAELAAQVEGSSQPLPQGEYEAIRAGRAFVYMYGSIRYDDVLGKPHTTQFSLIYSPTLGAFNAYQGHNKAD